MRRTKTFLLAGAAVLTVAGAGFALAQDRGGHMGFAGGDWMADYHHGGHEGYQGAHHGRYHDDHHDSHHDEYRDEYRGEGAGDGRGAMRGGRMMTQMLETYDANDDGALTQDEIDAARAARLAEFDADANGSLTLQEFQALWLDAMHEQMVDRFQSHDDDGDGQVTVEEFGEDFGRVVSRLDRNGDGILNADDLGPRGPRGQRGDGPARQ